MIRPTDRHRRGLTLVELMISTAITAMVATALTGMLHAVTTGVMTRRDARSAMVGAHTAQTRLTAYIAPSLCVLDAAGNDVVLWFDDSRESGTVHASEVRWIRYDVTGKTISVHFVDFPDGWTSTAELLADLECSTNQDWAALLNTYQAKGWSSSLTLVDGIESFAVSTNVPNAMDATQLGFDIAFASDADPLNTYVSGAIRLHVEPTNP